jgi:hypothetical protein
VFDFRPRTACLVIPPGLWGAVWLLDLREAAPPVTTEGLWGALLLLGDRLPANPTLCETLEQIQERTVATYPTQALRRDFSRACEQCGERFPDPKHRQRFCSRRCARLYQTQTQGKPPPRKRPLSPALAARLSTNAVMRRYCPTCQRFRILPDAAVCLCGARASRRFPTYVDIGADHPDAVEPLDIWGLTTSFQESTLPPGESP